MELRAHLSNFFYNDKTKKVERARNDVGTNKFLGGTVKVHSDAIIADVNDIGGSYSAAKRVEWFDLIYSLFKMILGQIETPQPEHPVGRYLGFKYGIHNLYSLTFHLDHTKASDDTKFCTDMSGTSSVCFNVNIPYQ